MRSETIFRISAVLLFSALVTATLYVMDHRRAKGHETAAALKWARQIASQAETMMLEGRERGEKDPLKWAVNVLSQGLEPRIVRLSKLTNDEAREIDSDSGETEFYQLSRSAGNFTYTRIFEASRKLGFKIVLEVGYSGFLGTRSRWTNDLATAGFFAALAISLLGLWSLLTKRRPQLAEVVPMPASEPFPTEYSDPRTKRISGFIQEWSGENKIALTRFTGDVRNLIRNAQQMLVSTKQSLNHTEALRQRIHQGLNQVHASRKTVQGALSYVSEARTLLALPATPESQRRLEELFAQLQGTFESVNQAVERLEIQVEPWATDADQAFQCQSSILQSSREMVDAIDQTKQGIITQARNLGQLEEQVSAIENQDPQVEAASKLGLSSDYQLPA